MLLHAEVRSVYMQAVATLTGLAADRHVADCGMLCAVVAFMNAGLQERGLSIHHSILLECITHCVSQACKCQLCASSTSL